MKKCECCGVEEIIIPRKKEDGKVYVCSACFNQHYHNDRETQALINAQPLVDKYHRQPLTKAQIASHLEMTVEEVEADIERGSKIMRQKLKKAGYER